MLTDDHAGWGFTASTGLAFTEARIVDAHFEACRDDYRSLLGQVGIRSGWHVLDAGCGSGDFLPWLAELVGPGGRVTGVDLTAENLAVARRFGVAAVQQGDVRCLPYAEDSFDAVWCANTTQYLDDSELAVVLRELRRVVRPGGLVAVKELDATLVTARPAAPHLFAEFFAAASAVPGYARQLVRSRDLYRYLKRAGLVEVRQRTVLIEHFAPLPARAMEFYGESCARLASQALELGLDGEWRRFVDPGASDHPLRQPDGYVSEGAVLAVGQVG